MRQTILLVALGLLAGCACPYVVGIAKTNKYVTGIYDVTDATVWGVGAIPGTAARVVVGYDHTIVRTVATGQVYEAMVRIKEYQLIEGTR